MNQYKKAVERWRGVSYSRKPCSGRRVSKRQARSNERQIAHQECRV